MQANQPMADHLRHLELVAQNTTNMVVVINGRREIEWVNPADTRVTGWTLDEVKGKNPKAFLHGPKTSMRDASRLGLHLRRGQAVTDFEMLNYKKSGEPYWVSLNIQPVANECGEITQYVAIESDITLRKRAELESARMLHQLAEAQRLAKLGLLEHELATGAAHCSPELLRILEADRHEVENTFEGVMSFVHPDDEAEVHQAYEDAVNTGGVFDAQFRLLTRRRHLRWVQARGTLEGWDDGRPALFRTVLQDITERKDGEQLLRDKQLLEQAQRTQMEVLSRISHELRTPLHAVLGFAEALERGEGDHLSARARGQLGHIREAARHLLLLVNDILDLTRLHGGSVPFDIRPVDVHALAQEVIAMMGPIAAARGVSLHVQQRSAAPVHGAADAHRLRQVLINLVHNAIKYNRPQGKVHVRLAASPSGEVAVSVVDTGIGISPAHQARLFEPFYRVPGIDLPLAPESSGLGLAIARSLARGMRGDIGVHSQPGAGSTFVLTLPSARPPAAAAPDTGRTSSPSARHASGTLLYIEDNEVNRLLVERYLAERPTVTLHGAATGAEGLALARQVRPSLLLVDMTLPDMSGLALMQAVLDDPLLHRTPCVAFSADASDGAVDAAIRAGFREYWVKPMARDAFLAAVDRVVGEEALGSRF
ncbi:MAG: PAS domain S-box protein [Rhizobacter sp.]|nr:PAS domain S-box protein [Rhizobacter sp.]